jgi:hypothetical protein
MTKIQNIFFIFSLCNADFVFSCQKIEQVRSTVRTKNFLFRNWFLFVLKDPEFNARFRYKGIIRKKIYPKKDNPEKLFF